MRARTHIAICVRGWDFRGCAGKGSIRGKTLCTRSYTYCNMCTGVGHEDVTAVGSAKAEARKREGGSYLSAVLTVLAQSAAAVALAQVEASAKTEALA